MNIISTRTITISKETSTVRSSRGIYKIKQYSPVSRGSPGFLHPCLSCNAISSGRLSGRTPPSRSRQGSPAYSFQGPTSTISSGRLSVRTPPSGGRIGTVQGTPSQSQLLPNTPK